MKYVRLTLSFQALQKNIAKYSAQSKKSPTPEKKENNEIGKDSESLIEDLELWEDDDPKDDFVIFDIPQKPS